MACTPVALFLAEILAEDFAMSNWPICLVFSYGFLLTLSLTLGLALGVRRVLPWIVLASLLLLDAYLVAEKHEPQVVRLANHSSHTLHGVVLAAGGHFEAERRMVPGAESVFSMRKDWKSMVFREPIRLMRSHGGRYAPLGSCGNLSLSSRVVWNVTVLPDGNLRCLRHVEDREYAPFTTAWREGGETEEMRKIRKEYEKSRKKHTEADHGRP